MRIRLLLALTAIALLGAATAALARTTWIVRDGFYVGSEDNFSELAFFHVANRRVRHLRFSMNLNCHNDNTGQDYDRNFSAGAAMPQDERIPSDGTLTIQWSETDAGRAGHITAELRFHRHPMASFSVTSAGGYEACNGFAAIRLHRSPRTPPVPSRP
jgi:hypothetical protein